MVILASLDTFSQSLKIINNKSETHIIVFVYGLSAHLTKIAEENNIFVHLEMAMNAEKNFKWIFQSFHFSNLFFFSCSTMWNMPHMIFDRKISIWNRLWVGPRQQLYQHKIYCIVHTMAAAIVVKVSSNHRSHSTIIMRLQRST